MKFSTPQPLALCLCPLLLAACSPTPIDMRTHYITDRPAEQHPAGHPHTAATKHAAFHATPLRNTHVAPDRRSAARPTPKPQAPAPAPPRHDTPARQAAREQGSSKYPTAKKAFREGYVISPYTGAKIPVGKVPHGARVLDPSSEKVFINP
jgi:hypothetical protein